MRSISRGLVAAGLAGAAVWAAPASAQESKVVAIRGRVVDGAGAAVAGATVATDWNLQQGRWVASAPVTTDADGRFSFTRPRYRRSSYGVMALTADGKLGAVAPVSLDAAGKELELAVQRLRRVQGHVEITQLPHLPGDVGITFTLSADCQFRAALRSGGGRIVCSLPPHTYHLRTTSDPNHRGFQREITVAAGAAPHDLGELKIGLSAVARSLGKAPPAWRTFAARNVPDGVTAAGESLQPGDFRGRWLLIEFWGVD